MLLHVRWIRLSRDIGRASVGAEFLGVIVSQGMWALLTVGVRGRLGLLVRWETVARIWRLLRLLRGRLLGCIGEGLRSVLGSLLRLGYAGFLEALAFAGQRQEIETHLVVPVCSICPDLVVEEDLLEVNTLRNHSRRAAEVDGHMAVQDVTWTLLARIRSLGEL